MTDRLMKAAAQLQPIRLKFGFTDTLKVSAAVLKLSLLIRREQANIALPEMRMKRMRYYMFREPGRQRRNNLVYPARETVFPELIAITSVVSRILPLDVWKF